MYFCVTQLSSPKNNSYTIFSNTADKYSFSYFVEDKNTQDNWTTFGFSCCETYPQNPKIGSFWTFGRIYGEDSTPRVEICAAPTLNFGDNFSIQKFGSDYRNSALYEVNQSQYTVKSSKLSFVLSYKEISHLISVSNSSVFLKDPKIQNIEGVSTIYPAFAPSKLSDQISYDKLSIKKSFDWKNLCYLVALFLIVVILGYFCRIFSFYLPDINPGLEIDLRKNRFAPEGVVFALFFCFSVQLFVLQSLTFGSNKCETSEIKRKRENFNT